MWAAYLKFPEIVKKLVENGAKIEMEDKNKNTAIILAKKSGYHEIKDFLSDALATQTKTA